MPSDKASQLNELERGEVGVHGGLDECWKRGKGGHLRLEVLRRSWRVVKAGQSVTRALFLYGKLQKKARFAFLTPRQLPLLIPEPALARLHGGVLPQDGCGEGCFAARRAQMTF